MFAFFSLEICFILLFWAICNMSSYYKIFATVFMAIEFSKYFFVFGLRLSFAISDHSMPTIICPVPFCKSESSPFPENYNYLLFALLK